jgi:hypothetical protein
LNRSSIEPENRLREHLRKQGHLSRIVTEGLTTYRREDGCWLLG